MQRPTFKQNMDYRSLYCPLEHAGVLWDGIKRDRIVWLGDMHPELMTISRVFGYNEVIPNSLDLACKQFPLPNWMNGMSAYSLWYLINQYEWYHQTGDIDF